MTKATAIPAILACFCLLAGTAQAGSTSATLTVNVTVVAEPCVINGDRPIVVDFGDSILTNGVDGSRYIKNVEYSLDCSNASGDDLTMTISGSGAGFDSTVLQANQPALGIKLLSDGNPMPLNHALNFSRNTPPVLQAVPVKDPAGTLTGGPLTASATMKVEYQ